MAKYIDADLLRKKITEQMDSVPHEVGRGAGTITSKGYGMMQAFQIMRSIIDSLQQEQAEKDHELTIKDLELLHTFLYAVKNNKQGAFTFTRLSDEQYDEVLKRFKEAKK